MRAATTPLRDVPKRMHCAIDFGTSNSGIAAPLPGGGVRLLEIEPGRPTMPTAVFYATEGLAPHEPPHRLYGRAAIAAYVDGVEGRLMRSMKSILGSTLAEQHTDLGAGHSVRYLDVVAGYLRHLKEQAQAQTGHALDRCVLGRPVFFVDGDPKRDAKAQAVLEAAAKSVGFSDVTFQYEPIAAALDYERQIDAEQIVLVADIGGGTSDFSLVRVGPQQRKRVERRDDILANHGVHVAGADFDRHIELARLLPVCGYKSPGPAQRGQHPREAPNRVYFDLATWHLINTVYVSQRVIELSRMRSFYANPVLHARLMRVVEHRLGHALAALAEQAKIDVSAMAPGDTLHIALDAVEQGLSVALSPAQVAAVIDADVQRIIDAARQTLRMASLPPRAVNVLYLTGGSTGLPVLAERLSQVCPQAATVRGDRFASVAQGLCLHAQRWFGR
jgi:hypothetical chaperone protein